MTGEKQAGGSRGASGKGGGWGSSRIVLAVVAVVVLGGGSLLWVGVWVMYPEMALGLRPDPNRADQSRAGLIALMERGQPAAKEGVADGYAIFREAHALRTQIDDAGWKVRPLPPHSSLPLFGEAFVAASGKEKANTLADRALAREVLGEYVQGGLFEKLDAMWAAERAVRGVEFDKADPDRLLWNLLLPDLGHARYLARVANDRARGAALAGDRAGFLRAQRQMFGIARVIARQPMTFDRMVAQAIVALALSRTREMLLEWTFTPADDGFLMELSGVMRDPAGWPPLTVAFEGERIGTLDSVRWILSTDGPSLRRKLEQLQGLSGGVFGSAAIGLEMSGRRKTMRELEEFYAKSKAVAEMTTLERMSPKGVSAKAVVGSESRNPVLQVLLPALTNFVRSADQLAVDLVGTRTMIALERARLASGEYPASIEGLREEGATGSATIGTVPIDPYSGKPLMYKRLGAGEDAAGWRYLLWSVAADAKDNGGKFGTANNRFQALIEANRAEDFQVNFVEVNR